MKRRIDDQVETGLLFDMGEFVNSAIVTKNMGSKIGCHCWGTDATSIELLKPAAEAGCRWVRSTRPMQMEQVATGPRTYDFAPLESSVNQAVSQGMSVLGILDGRWGHETLINKLPWCSPIWEHLDNWADFVTQTVRYYKDRVKYWEVINEPPFFWWYPTPEGVVVPEQNPMLRRAPVRHYAALLKVTAQAIRKEDPDAKILCGAGFADGSFLEHLYENGCREAFDIVAVHYLSCRNREDFHSSWNRIQEVMAKYGDAGKPIWDTENGPGGAVIGQVVKTPADYDGLYSIYRHCFAHEVGLERYFWFNATFHGFTADGSSNAYRAIRVLHEQVGEGRLLTSRTWQDISAYVFDGPRGPVSILFSTGTTTVDLANEAAGCDWLGQTLAPASRLVIDARPIFLQGDVTGDLNVVSREAVSHVLITPMKQPAADAPHIRGHRLTGRPQWDDPVWEEVPMIARHETIPLPQQVQSFVMGTSSIAADLKVAYSADDLLIWARTYDTQHDGKGALLQLAIRDSDPEVKEWPYFSNAYGLFHLFASKHGPCVLRSHRDVVAFPTGAVPGASIQMRRHEDGITICAAIPWAQIGPCRPGRNNPFLLMLLVSREDNLLDLPCAGDAQEWYENFMFTFIVKPPAVSVWMDMHQ